MILTDILLENQMIANQTEIEFLKIVIWSGLMHAFIATVNLTIESDIFGIAILLNVIIE